MYKMQTVLEYACRSTMRKSIRIEFWLITTLSFAILLHAIPISPVGDKPEHKAIETDIQEQTIQQNSVQKLEFSADEDDQQFDLDPRSSFINNQYLADIPMDEEMPNNQPLYEILQKQMEHVLATTGKDLPVYSNGLQHESMQRPPNRPAFSNLNVEDADEDAENDYDTYGAGAGAIDETIDDAQIEEVAGYRQPEQQETMLNAANTTTTAATTVSTTTTTSTNSRPKTTKGKPHITRAPPKSTTTTAEPPKTVTKTFATTQQHHHQKTQILRPTSRPSSLQVPNDTHTNKHIRRIIFKTISTGSQFVASPIGDLMIKYSIGFAKPLISSATTTSNVSNAQAETVNEDCYGYCRTAY